MNSAASVSIARESGRTDRRTTDERVMLDAEGHSPGDDTHRGKLTLTSELYCTATEGLLDIIFSRVLSGYLMSSSNRTMGAC